MEIPNGVPFDYHLATQLSNSGFTGTSVAMDENVKPTTDQFALKPGDYAMAVDTPALVDDQNTVLRIVDPNLYAVQYPDWESRLQRSYVLTEWYSESHHEQCLGWFARVKLMPITTAQYDEVLSWFQGTPRPDDAPTWMDDAYYRYTSMLADNAPHEIPRAVECGACGNHNVEIHLVSMRTYANRAGMIVTPPDLHHDGLGRHYVNLNEGDEKRDLKAHLHCRDCEGRLDLSEAEVRGLVHMNKHFAEQ